MPAFQSMVILGQAFQTFIVVAGVALLIVVGLLIIIIKCYRKVIQGQALIRNGMGGTKVCFSGMIVIPTRSRMAACRSFFSVSTALSLST